MIKNRKNNRVKDFDYSSTGYYFVTMCIKNREMLFGELKDNIMFLNQYGEIIKKHWLDLPKHHPNIILDTWIIMPDHIHGIIIIDNEVISVGTGLPVITESKDDTWKHCNIAEKPVLSNPSHRTRTGLSAIITCPNNKSTLSIADDKPVPTHKSKNLSEIIRGFKTFSSRQINKQWPFQWQRSFHDHIIRNDQDLERIRDYIINNPQKHFNKQIETQWE